MLRISFPIFILITIFSLTSCRRNTPAINAIEGISEVAYDSKQAAPVTLPPENVAEVASRFTPLADNERFAFSVENTRIYLTAENMRFPQGIWVNNMTVYTIRNDNTENISKLFTWEDVIWSSIQFTSDFKNIFFVPNYTYRRIVPTANFPLCLYIANGYTGEIRRLLAGVVGNADYRVSRDGRFVLFQGNENNREFAHLFLFDVESNVIVSEFEWRPNRHGDLDLIEGWTVHRFDNVFRIYAVSEFGFIRAVAELNLATMELETLWNHIDESALSSRPNVYDDDWIDDVSRQHRDPTIWLQRRSVNKQGGQ